MSTATLSSWTVFKWHDSITLLDKHWRITYTIGVKQRANDKQGDVKMKRRELSPIELKKLVELRQLGAKWTEIEQETKVERRAAKRAYEEWEKDKEAKEQQAVRFRVAAEAFHEHMSDLIRVAESFVSALRVPGMLQGLENADGVLDHLQMKSIQGEPEPFPTSNEEIQRVVRRNRMLLKSLQDHTRDKVRWEGLEEWKQSRHNGVQYSKELRLKATEVIRNSLNDCFGLEKRIKTAIGDNDVIERIADGVIGCMWRGILTGKPDEMHVVEGISVFTEGQVWLVFYEGDSETRLNLNDKQLAKEVWSMCGQVVANLREGAESDLVRKLTDEVSQMQARTKELEESLDELVLRPMILHSWCDLCPA